MLNMRIVLFFFFIFSIVILSEVEACSQSDSAKAKNISLKPSFDFDQRFSFIRGSSVNIWGERIGILVNEKFKVGIGGYYLSDQLKYKKVDSLGNPFYYGNRHLYFGTVYYEKFLLRRNLWELSVPVEIGFGKSYFDVYKTYTNALVLRTIKDFVPVGTGISLSFKCPPVFGIKPFRWLGINGLIGYRYDLGTLAANEGLLPSNYSTAYNGMFWSISGTIFLDRMVDDIKDWKKKRRERKSISK